MTTLEPGLVRLQPRHRREVLRLLREQPAQNTYLLGQIARGALHADEVAGPLIGWRVDGTLQGVCVCGSNLVVSSPASPEAIAAFAGFARQGRYRIRVAVGPDQVMAEFMERFGRTALTIRRERADQILFRLQRDDFEARTTLDSLRTAELREMEAVIRLDRLMVTEELGYDPFSRDMRSYRAGWKRRIREERTYVVGPVGGELIFKAELSAVSDDAAQVSGVYTAESSRRTGIARGAMGEIAARVFKDAPLVTLYVHGENFGAIRLYENLGFERAGLVRSVWFGE